MAIMATLRPIDTAEFRAMSPTSYRRRPEAAAAATPSRHGLTVDDSADAVCQIAQPSMSMVQEQTITGDGGLAL
jgi:hypothetical protein